MDKLKIVYRKTDDLKPYANNPRVNDKAVDAVAKSIEEFGFKVPIVVDKNGIIVAGHTRLKACKKLGIEEVPCIVAEDLSDEEIKAFRLADNKAAEMAEWDWDKLEAELMELGDMDLDFDMQDFGFDNVSAGMTLMEKVKNNPMDSSLFDTFIVPPFSILNTSTGYWQDRKKQWIDYGLKSEVGREDNMVFSANLNAGSLKGTSLFDPVLCEIIYKWFMPTKGGKIIDCFAGGPPRGIIAEKSGHSYLGVDLRKEQVDSNYENAKELSCDLNKLKWIADDSSNIDMYAEDNEYDLLFTCPPYFDLEVYSDDDKDISNMDYENFTRVYTDIIKKTARKVKDNRFAVVVISDVRDDKGYYRDLTGLTKKAFLEEGFGFYNDIILQNAIGTGALRARKTMTYRKVTRVHQNVLVFFKGDPNMMAEDFEILKEIEELSDESLVI